MLKILDKIQENLLNVMFPMFCSGCNKTLLKNEKVICTKCNHNLPFTFHTNCQLTELDKVFYGIIPIEYTASLLYFTKKGITQNLMHNLKYKNRQEIGTVLGNLFALELSKVTEIKTIDYIIPVPLHTKRLHERGYNQVTTFCEALEQNLSIPIITDVLIKSKNIKSQINKSKIARQENKANVFNVINCEKIEGKHLVIVDDIFTTGATIEACAKALLGVKNTKISILTMAYTQ